MKASYAFNKNTKLLNSMYSHI